MQNQGGARAKVTALELNHASAEPVDGGPAFETECEWIVTGSVGHWGHVHTRQNRYHAKFTVAPLDDAWKITTLELLDETRL